MIAGTPVLDIKPYIPEYDSPHTRVGIESQPCESDQLKVSASPLNETTDMLSLSYDSETDAAQSNLKAERTEDSLGNQLSEDLSRVRTQFLLPEDIRTVLDEVRHYVSQSDQIDSESQPLLDSLKTKPQELTADRPCYGEETYSTIAGWIREPPVASLDVRFTPHAERELAEFLPTHLSGKSSRIMYFNSHLYCPTRGNSFFSV